MPAFLYRLEAWEKIGKDEMNEIEKTQGRGLKRIFNLPISTSYIGLIMKQVHGQLTKEYSIAQ